MSSYEYDTYFDSNRNKVMALYKIAEALNKLADNIGKQYKMPQLSLEKDFENVSDKLDQIYQIAKATYAAQDVKQIKEQLGQIQGHLEALSRLIQKKENP